MKEQDSDAPALVKRGLDLPPNAKKAALVAGPPVAIVSAVALAHPAYQIAGDAVQLAGQMGHAVGAPGLIGLGAGATVAALANNTRAAESDSGKRVFVELASPTLTGLAMGTGIGMADPSLLGWGIGLGTAVGLIGGFAVAAISEERHKESATYAEHSRLQRLASLPGIWVAGGAGLLAAAHVAGVQVVPDHVLTALAEGGLAATVVPLAAAGWTHHRSSQGRSASPKALSE